MKQLKLTGITKVITEGTNITFEAINIDQGEIAAQLDFEIIKEVYEDEIEAIEREAYQRGFDSGRAEEVPF